MKYFHDVLHWIGLTTPSWSLEDMSLVLLLSLAWNWLSTRTTLGSTAMTLSSKDVLPLWGRRCALPWWSPVPSNLGLGLTQTSLLDPHQAELSLLQPTMLLSRWTRDCWSAPLSSRSGCPGCSVAHTAIWIFPCLTSLSEFLSKGRTLLHSRPIGRSSDFLLYLYFLPLWFLCYWPLLCISVTSGLSLFCHVRSEIL